jgi:hypothetical protein
LAEAEAAHCGRAGFSEGFTADEGAQADRHLDPTPTAPLEAQPGKTRPETSSVSRAPRADRKRTLRRTRGSSAPKSRSVEGSPVRQFGGRGAQRANEPPRKKFTKQCPRWKTTMNRRETRQRSWLGCRGEGRCTRQPRRRLQNGARRQQRHDTRFNRMAQYRGTADAFTEGSKQTTRFAKRSRSTRSYPASRFWCCFSSVRWVTHSCSTCSRTQV